MEYTYSSCYDDLPVVVAQIYYYMNKSPVTVPIALHGRKVFGHSCAVSQIKQSPLNFTEP